MKRFTVLFSILLVLGFAGVLVYVGTSPEFVPPDAFAAVGEDPDAPVWSMTLDEVLAELEDQGLIDRSTTGLLASGGLCTEAFKISGAEFYWWDLETLDPDSDEFAAYKSLKEEGVIDIYNSGSIISPVHNGPFSVLLTWYEGDESALEKAFMAIGQTGGTAGGEDDPVWDMTLDDLANYMAEGGWIDLSTKFEYAKAFQESTVVAYSGLSFYWWDVDNLQEGTEVYDEYHSVQESGAVTYQNGATTIIVGNGPFGMYYEDYTGEDLEGVIAAFKAFGH